MLPSTLLLQQNAQHFIMPTLQHLLFLVFFPLLASIFSFLRSEYNHGLADCGKRVCLTTAIGMETSLARRKKVLDNFCARPRLEF